jgi:ABC-type transporter Mla subunit MlaD
MTDEQFAKRMEFILEQQAQFATSIQRLEEAQAKTDEPIQALAAVSLSFANHFESLMHHAEDADRRLASFVTEANEKIGKLAEAQASTDQRLGNFISETREAIRKLAESQVDGTRILTESQAHTDQRLDVLIDIVRRQLEGRNEQQDQS